MTTLESLFEMLGREVSMSEKKRPLPAATFDCLGVSIDFSRAHSKMVIMANKEGRIEGILEMVKDILKRNRMGFKEALLLKGKLQFAPGCSSN